MSMTDRLKGNAKEVAGSVTGSDVVREEGAARGQTASRGETVERACEDADRHEQHATVHEERERDNRGTRAPL